MALITPEDRAFISYLLDPEHPQREYDVRDWSSPPQETVGALSEVEREALIAEILSIEHADHLDADTVRRFLADLPPWDANFLQHLLVLNPGLTCEMAGNWYPVAKAHEIQRFLAFNPAAIFTLTETNRWDAALWDKIFEDLPRRFRVALDGCHGWAYPKAIAGTWIKSDDDVLQWIGQYVAPVAVQIPCPLPIHRTQESEAVWKKRLLQPAAAQELGVALGLDNRLFQQALSLLEKLGQRLPLRVGSGFDTIMPILRTEVALLRERRWPWLQIAALLVHDLRATEAIAQTSRAWHALQLGLEDI